MKDDILKISLAAARVNAGMTQDEVSKALHVSKKSLVNWESGKTTPSFIVFHALADLYRISVDNIYLPSKSTLSGQERRKTRIRKGAT